MEFRNSFECYGTISLIHLFKMQEFFPQNACHFIHAYQRRELRWGCSIIGSAADSKSEGRRFESCQLQIPFFFLDLYFQLNLFAIFSLLLLFAFFLFTFNNLFIYTFLFPNFTLISLSFSGEKRCNVFFINKLFFFFLLFSFTFRFCWVFQGSGKYP